MSGLIDKIFGQVRINHVWLFVTERCNLACDYCFFGERDGRTTISMPMIRTLFATLPLKQSDDVVISGGEPLLEWRRTRDVVLFVRSQHPDARLMVQTNGLLLDRTKLAFLAEHRVALEFGIDGSLAANGRHRRGIRDIQYDRLLRNITWAVRAGLRTCATMTVHPSETERMGVNFGCLADMGFDSIEVHPAFMAPWTPRHAAEFARGYRHLLARDIKSGRRMISPYYSRSVPPLMDIVVQPDGKVLPAWTYLIFPKTFREPFYLMELSPNRNGVKVRQAAMADYLKGLRRFFTKPRTYREFSNFHARRVLALNQDDCRRRAFRAYELACRKAQALDLRCFPAGKLV